MDRSNKGCLVVVGFLLMLPFLGWAGARIYNEVIFDREIGGRLKRAADANSITLAKQELEAALGKMETRHMTEGYTSIIYTTPDEDVGFWYKNIKTCVQQINDLSPTATQGEQDLVLLKLRQTLLDHSGKGGEHVTVPPGICVFPHNTMFAVWLWLSSILGLVGCLCVSVPFVK